MRTLRPYLDSTGTRRWAVVHGSLDDAEAKRAELRLRRRRGERNKPVRTTFAEYAWEWLERQPVRERTREAHSWALREHLIPYFGRRRLDQITVDDVAGFITHMRRKGLRGSTTLTALRPLSRVLAHAARRGAVPVNPCSQLERGERPRLDDQRPKRILTLEEMKALVACADSERYRCLLQLLLTGGLRTGRRSGSPSATSTASTRSSGSSTSSDATAPAPRSRPPSHSGRSTSRPS